MDFTPQELLIAAIVRMLHGLNHVAVGASSPIPGAAALAARKLSGGHLRVSVLGSRKVAKSPSLATSCTAEPALRAILPPPPTWSSTLCTMVPTGM